ncbi:hypothetical protein CROQUDRAFT_196478 [Cronartium quercuum f. sp. fusiforme G11]|uniref:Uncharacterized protein n=1 Tax=Cronartium quercuum f. sp. fusiforme G11 TaxID=708437 RepID=A0A9P6TFH4_9BASI|nr:hypothetical protein CROQUDRAFT_196478 [Cronartium quercuum f. sp. fusiforme G11]
MKKKKKLQLVQKRSTDLITSTAPGIYPARVQKYAAMMRTRSLRIPVRRSQHAPKCTAVSFCEGVFRSGSVEPFPEGMGALDTVCPASLIKNTINASYAPHCHQGSHTCLKGNSKSHFNGQEGLSLDNESTTRPSDVGSSGFNQLVCWISLANRASMFHKAFQGACFTKKSKSSIVKAIPQG